MRSSKLAFPGHDGTSLDARLESPPGTPRAYAIFAHCFTCSKDTAAASRISRALGASGIATLRFDFTGLGGSDGDFANTNFSSNIADLRAAAKYLADHFTAPSLLVGHSLGGAAVLAAAADLDSVTAVATIGAPSDPGHVEHLFAGSLDTIREHGQAEVCLAGRTFTVKEQFLDDLGETRFQAKLGALDDKAVLIMHSPDDEVVHLDHARRLYSRIQHPKSFVSLPGANHMLTGKQDALYAADVLRAWAGRFLPEVDADATGSDVPHGHVRVSGDGAGFTQDVFTEHHALLADEPKPIGGDDLGPAPYEWLLGSLGTCTSMTLGMYARRKKWPLTHVTVDLQHERRDGDPPIAHITRTIKLEGDLNQEQRARLLEIADRCPVHRTLSGPIEIRSELAP